MDGILTLMQDPAAWASFLTLVALEIVLGIDNVIFISIVANRLPEDKRRLGRTIGLAGALVMRIILLASLAWIIKLTYPVFELPFGSSQEMREISWRDIILIVGGAFLIWKATKEIHGEVRGEDHGAETTVAQATFGAVIFQIMLLDLVFSLDSVITAVGVAEHLEIMIAAVIIAIIVMMVAAGPVARFVEANPTTKMLALSFLVMIGMALVADGAGFHIPRGYIYGAMLFSTFVEVLNLLRDRRARRKRAAAE